VPGCPVEVPPKAHSNKTRGRKRKKTHRVPHKSVRFVMEGVGFPSKSGEYEDKKDDLR